MSRWKTSALNYIDQEIPEDFPTEWFLFITGKKKEAKVSPTSHRLSNTEFPGIGRTRLEPIHQGPLFSSSGELDPIVCVSIICYNIIEKYGLHALGMDFLMAGPKHIFDVFCGNIPNSLEAEWLDHESALKAIVIQAYRVSYKILVDQVTLIGSPYPMEELMVCYNK